MNRKILIITITCFSCLFLFTGFVVGDKSEWTEEKIQERKGKRDSLTDEEKAANMKAWNESWDEWDSLTNEEKAKKRKREAKKAKKEKKRKAKKTEKAKKREVKKAEKEKKREVKNAEKEKVEELRKAERDARTLEKVEAENAEEEQKETQKEK